MSHVLKTQLFYTFIIHRFVGHTTTSHPGCNELWVIQSVTLSKICTPCGLSAEKSLEGPCGLDELQVLTVFSTRRLPEYNKQLNKMNVSCFIIHLLVILVMCKGFINPTQKKVSTF